MFMHETTESGGTMAAFGSRWVRLNITYFHDPKIRKAKCAAIWPYLIGLMGEYGGYIPDDYLDADLIADDLGIDSETAARQLDGAKRVGLINYGSEQVDVGGRGGPNLRKREGWTTSNWRKYQPDNRRNSSKRKPEQTVPGNVKPPRTTERNETNINPQSPPTGFSEIETIALSCIPSGGRRGRGVCLDPMSQRTLMKLIDEHGAQRVVEGLSECGGAERPVAMLKKILSKTTGRASSAPPTADEWRGG